MAGTKEMRAEVLDDGSNYATKDSGFQAQTKTSNALLCVAAEKASRVS